MLCYCCYSQCKLQTLDFVRELFIIFTLKLYLPYQYASPAYQSQRFLSTGQHDRAEDSDCDECTTNNPTLN